MDRLLSDIEYLGHEKALDVRATSLVNPSTNCEIGNFQNQTRRHVQNSRK